MKKVKGRIELIRLCDGIGYENWGIEILEKEKIIENCLQQWHKTAEATSILLDIEIKSKFQFKTNSQLGYLYAEVLPKFYEYMEEMGDDSSDEMKKTQLKTHPEIGFYETKECIFTGHDMIKERSFASASKDELSDFIDKAIRLGAEFGIIIQTPEEYKKIKGINEFV